MSFGKDFSLEEGMSSAVEGGAALAWRLLATLEGGSLLLATSALLAYAVSHKIACHSRPRRSIRHVLVTNTTNLLGRELKRRLEMRGCVVETAAQPSGDVSGAAGQLSGGVKGAAGSSASVGSSERVDAIVVVGAEHEVEGLDGMAGLVTEDVHNNLRLLECVSPRLHDGGFIAWACARDVVPTDAFSDAGAAFDTVLHANLVHIAKLRQCEAIWVGRRPGAALAAEQTVDALLATSRPGPRAFSVRNAAHRLGECLGRWLKLVT